MIKEIPHFQELQKMRSNGINILIPSFKPAQYPLMLIEEIPTKEETKTGNIGGKFWDIVNFAIKETKLTVDQFYLTSVIKQRPNENRYPTKDEVIEWFPYLVQEVNIVKPQYVLFFGKSCFKYFVHVEGGFEVFNKVFPTRICKKTIVTYNPQSLIRGSSDYFRFKSILRRVIISIVYNKG